MSTIHGVVQGNVVILPADANLPDGAAVEVLVASPNGKRAGNAEAPDQFKTRNQRSRPQSLGVGASGHANTARRTAEERPEPRSWR